MKRIYLLLASLTAIALFACSNDNSISSAEDADYSPVKALQKAPVDITPYGTGSVTRTCSGSMSVYNVPYNTYAKSNDVSCNFVSTVPSGSTIVKIELTSSPVTGAVGVFTISDFIIRCGNYTDTIPWNGWATTVFTSPTSPIVGTPANVICYASFYGKCNATGTGGVGCSHSRNSVTMTMYYNY